MSIVNTEKVLFGTDQKIFDAAYHELLANFTEENSDKFFMTYKSMSLSFILKNALAIMKEPYHGTQFFIDLILGNNIPFHKVNELLDIASSLVEEARQNKVSAEQFTGYCDIESKLKNIQKKFKNTIDLYSISSSRDNVGYMDTTLDYLYDIKINGSAYEFYDLAYTIMDTCKDAYICISLLIALMLNNTEYGTLYDFLYRCLTYEETNLEDDARDTYIDKFKNDVKLAICLCSKDEEIINQVSLISQNFKYLWLGVVSDGLSKPQFKQESTTEKIPIFSQLDLIERMVHESSDDVLNDDVNKCKKYDFYIESKAYYESKLQYFLTCESLGIDTEKIDAEVYESCINEIDANISFLEWTDDGEPDPVIKTHIMTKKEIEREKQQKDDAKKKAKEDAIMKTNQEEDSDLNDDLEEEETDKKKVTSVNIQNRKKAVDLAFKAIRSINNNKEHVVAKEKKSFEDGEKNSLCLGSFKKEDYDNLLSAIKDGIKPVSDNFRVSEDNYFTIFLDVKPSSDYYMEASSDVPQEPKEDLATRIQNKAIDHEAKRQEKKSLNEEKKVKLKNAGKALSAAPKDWEKSSKDLASKIGQWDVKRRKEFFLKPGFRHKIFRNMKNALLYGGVAKAKITMLPLAMLIRHFSKEKDRRIRNELVRELDTEIKICEEKINDANSNGDQQEKYKLMRLKDKLTAEKNRVQLNSKYI